MTERQYHTCHEKGMDNILSMSRAQQLSSSPWFYVVYCKACVMLMAYSLKMFLP